jgi:hypothetical protein
LTIVNVSVTFCEAPAESIAVASWEPPGSCPEQNGRGGERCRIHSEHGTAG